MRVFVVDVGVVARPARHRLDVAERSVAGAPHREVLGAADDRPPHRQPALFLGVLLPHGRQALLDARQAEPDDQPEGEEDRQHRGGREGPPRPAAARQYAHQPAAQQRQRPPARQGQRHATHHDGQRGDDPQAARVLHQRGQRARRARAAAAGGQERRQQPHPQPHAQVEVEREMVTADERAEHDALGRERPVKRLRRRAEVLHDGEHGQQAAVDQHGDAQPPQCGRRRDVVAHHGEQQQHREQARHLLARAARIEAERRFRPARRLAPRQHLGASRDHLFAQADGAGGEPTEHRWRQRHQLRGPEQEQPDQAQRQRTLRPGQPPFEEDPRRPQQGQHGDAREQDRLGERVDRSERPRRQASQRHDDRLHDDPQRVGHARAPRRARSVEGCRRRDGA